MREITLKAVTVFILFWALHRCFYGLGDLALERWDEQTNAQVVGELVNNATYPRLTINGEPFLEKPPLWYYLTGFSVWFLGYSAFALRLTAAASGFLIICIILALGNKWYGKAGGILSAAALLSTEHLFVVNPGGHFSTHTFRSADGDSLMMLCMMLSSYAYSLRNTQMLGGAAWGTFWAGLGFLAKGPLAFVPIVVYVLHKRFIKKEINFGANFTEVTKIWIAILGIFTLVNIFFYGEAFITRFIAYHIFHRVITPLEGHAQDINYYVMLLFDKRVFLWFELYLCSLFLLIVFFRKKLGDYKLFMPVVSSVLILGIVTITQTKLAWYLLPFYPYAALVISGLFGILRR